MPKFTLIADSTQITTFLECPQKWLNKHFKHIEPIGYQPDDAMSEGTYGHRLLDIYYRARFNNVSVKDAIKLVYAYDPDQDMCACGCSKDLHQPVEILNIEECTRCKKCLEFRPQAFSLSTKDRQKVQRRFNEYTQVYEKNDFIPLSDKHVEVGFSNVIYEDDENKFILEGRIDLIAKWQGLDCVFVDHKFQRAATWYYPKSVQFKNYALATGITTGVINYIRTTAKVEKDITLARRVINFNQFELAEWQKRVITVFFKMKRTIQAHQSTKDGVERNWAVCGGLWTTWKEAEPHYCWYNQLCETIDKTIADGKEKTLYKINENPWKPW